MKKNVFALLIVMYLLFPSQVLACTGIDKNGRTYYHDHTNTDVTIMPMLYAEKHHLYTKNVQMNDDGFNEDIIISEIFSLPFIQTNEAYIGYYFDVDEQLKDLYWETIDDIEKLNLKTDVEGIDNLLLGQANYKINIGLKNTFQDSKKHVKNNTELMYYNVFIKNLALANEDSDYVSANKMITNRALNLAVPEILKIEMTYAITDNSWNNEKINVDKLNDVSQVLIQSEQKQDEVVAINLNKKLNASDVIVVTYDDSVKSYKFEIEEPGIYALVNADFDVELFNSDFEDSTLNEVQDGSNILMILVVILTITVLISAIIVLIQKRKK